jgi:hypothetical protein
VIADLAQSIRQIVRIAMGMPANSVRPEDQVAGVGGQIDHLATVKVMMVDEVGWPAITYSADPDNAPNGLLENVDQLLRLHASVNFYRGGTANNAGIANWTLKAADDAARLPQRLKMTAIHDQLTALGLYFVDASHARDLTALLNVAWRSRGQIDLRFYAVNRESAAIGSLGSGTFTTKFRTNGREITDTTTVTS